MTDQAHPSRNKVSPLRFPPAQPRRQPEEPGLCALKDYTCLTGESFAMRSLRAQLRRVSPHFRIALITGEAGTGVETVALALHRLNAESDASFISHTSASLMDLLSRLSARGNALRTIGPGATAESGHVYRSELLGTFGRRGTVFISDVGELNAGDQALLHAALHGITALRNGADRPRIIFGAGRDLRGLSGAGHFDRSLYRTISAVEILLPPLRSRPEDIPLITSAVLSRSAPSGSMTAGAFDGQALSRLQCHDWPGNVHELERVVEIARQQAGEGIDGIIESMHLPALGEFLRRDQQTRIEARVERLDDVIQNHVLDVLLRCSGNKVRAAERLGISRSTLYRMLDAGVSPQEVHIAAPVELDRTA